MDRTKLMDALQAERGSIERRMTGDPDQVALAERELERVDGLLTDARACLMSPGLLAFVAVARRRGAAAEDDR